MVAHARTRAARCAVHAYDAHHQARARPIGQGVKCRCVGVLARISVAAQMGIDEPLVFRLKVSPGQPELFEQRMLVVGDKHVRGFDQPNEHLSALG